MVFDRTFFFFLPDSDIIDEMTNLNQNTYSQPDEEWSLLRDCNTWQAVIFNQPTTDQWSFVCMHNSNSLLSTYKHIIFKCN